MIRLIVTIFLSKRFQIRKLVKFLKICRAGRDKPDFSCGSDLEFLVSLYVTQQLNNIFRFPNSDPSGCVLLTIRIHNPSAVDRKSCKLDVDYI